MATGILCAGLVLALVLLYRKTASLPSVFRAVAKSLREQDDSRAVDAMKEAVAVRAGQAVIAIQTYQEQMATSLRAQIAEAETRARVGERRAADTATALEAASTLVRELRAAIDAAARLCRALEARRPSRPPLPTTRPPSAPAPDDEIERQTTEMPSPPALPRAGDEAGFGDDEQTRVADRPAGAALVRRARLIPVPGGRAEPRSPTILPPGPDGGRHS